MLLTAAASGNWWNMATLNDCSINDIWGDSGGDNLVETLVIDEIAKRNTLTKWGDVFGDLNYMYHPPVQKHKLSTNTVKNKKKNMD